MNGEKTLIEFQSRYHDGNEEFDTAKKDYAILNGYCFYSFDHRTNSVESVLKTLFDINLCDVIDEIDIKKSQYRKINKADILLCQKYINQNYTIQEISNITNISVNVLYHCLNNGILKNSEERRKVVFNKCPVVQLDEFGNYVDKYDSRYDVYKKFNWRIGVLKDNKAISGYGYFWLKEYDYNNQTYTLPKKVRIISRKE